MRPVHLRAALRGRFPCDKPRVPETENPEQPPQALLETLNNLSRFHREHEKFYA